jgi:hypothetical protein
MLCKGSGGYGNSFSDLSHTVLLVVHKSSQMMVSTDDLNQVGGVLVQDAHASRSVRTKVLLLNLM